jgi:nicotinate phosphoribosyltransferase
MGVSGDVPWLDIAYKLVEYGNRPVLKLSTAKVSWPGRKQVFRLRDQNGQLAKDIVGLRDEQVSRAEPLLQKVMENGKTTAVSSSLEDLRAAFREEFGRLPEPVKAITQPAEYPVEFTPPLRALRQQIERKVTNGG